MALWLGQCVLNCANKRTEGLRCMTSRWFKRSACTSVLKPVKRYNMCGFMGSRPYIKAQLNMNGSVA